MLDTAALFHEAWDLELLKRQEQSPSFKPEDYTATGRAAASYGGKRSAAWWYDNGPGLVDNWVEWRKRTKWPIWETPAGETAIELQLNITLPGSSARSRDEGSDASRSEVSQDIPVKMFIDRVFVLPSGEFGVVDLKSGRLPETEEQLGLYATGIELTYGAAYRPTWGFFWDAQKGDHGKPLNLTRWTPALFAEMYKGAIAGINSGCFLPSPANNCKSWCGVSRHCAAVNGPEAVGVDPLVSPTKEQA